jgi:PadR family transcriptional regulator AphA
MAIVGDGSFGKLREVVPASAVRDAAPSSTPFLLAEYVVLGLIAEGPAHGFAVARLVTADGALGRVYQIPRPMVYRSISRLTDAALVEPVRVEHSTRGPQRTVVRITSRGRRALRDWLRQPVSHVRDVRTELLAKLALMDRSGADPGPLLAAQRQVLEPIVAGLDHELAGASGFDRTIAAWRYQTAQAAVRFLDDVERAYPATGSARRKRGS